MKLSLRWRFLLTLIPLLLLVVTLGSAGAILLHQLGGSIDAILRENYRSVIYMERLSEAVERIDSSFHIALAGRDDAARLQYREHWKAFNEALDSERENITLPGEADLVDELTTLGKEYRRTGDAFFDHQRPEERNQTYFRKPGGLLELFGQVEGVSNRILRINQENMEQASSDAQAAARLSLIGFAIGFALAVTLAGFLAWRTIRSIVEPIRAVTDSARAISAGDLDQVVPVVSNDELGQVAEAFNLMAHRLRDYRQSQSEQLLRVQRTTQATIDSFPDPVMVIDPDGRVERANPAAHRMLGVSPSLPDPLQQPLNEALRGQQDYLPEGFDKALLIGGDGRERAVLPRILTIRDSYGSVLGAAVLLQDVTRLRLLDQVKGDLVATASHELKTPLTSIQLAVHLLLEEAAGPLTPKQTELLLDGRENCERLLAMVNNLLDLARLEQGWRQLNVRPEAAAPLLEAAADTIRPRAHDKGVDIVLDVAQDLPPLAVDAVRIGTALRNLVDNALTYTDSGGRITLAARAAEDSVVLSVSDTGIGIASDYIPHIFDKFVRIPGQSRGSGTGLGLTIVHEIVVAHGGTITCESQPGVGTTFRLTLPVASGSPSPGTIFGHVDGKPAPRTQ